MAKPEKNEQRLTVKKNAEYWSKCFAAVSWGVILYV